MRDIREVLNIKIESPYWDEAYKKALAEPQLPEWLTKDYIQAFHNEYNIFEKNLDVVLSAAPFVAENPNLCLLAKTLANILANKTGFSKSFTEFELPAAPETAANTIGYDCLALFPIIANLRPTCKELEERGMEKHLISSSLFFFDRFITAAIEKAGKPAFGKEHFSLYNLVIYITNFIFGRLRFEIHKDSNRPVRIFANKGGELCVLMDNIRLHKSGHILGSFNCTDEEGAFDADFVETDETYEGYTVDKATRLVKKARVTLSKKEWKPVFVPGDDVIKVHIPNGGRMTKELCEESYRIAMEVFPRCFPETTFKGFLIGCWMLSPELKDILAPDSNIISFQSKYEIFPLKNNAADAFLYVFDIKDTLVEEIDLAALPEANSLMRGIKAKSLEGKYIHQFNGFIPW